MKIQDVATPQTAGDDRHAAQVLLVVIADDPRPTPTALTAYTNPRAMILPHYYLDRQGNVYRLVETERAGRGIGAARYHGFPQGIDEIAISLVLQKRPTAGYDGPLLRSLHALLDDLRAHYWLDLAAVVRIARRQGQAEVVPYVPPTPALLALDSLIRDPYFIETYETELPLGSSSPDAAPLLGAAAPTMTPISTAEVWEWLYSESYKPRGGTLRFDWAFTVFAATKGLGAPVAPNPKQPLISGGVAYNFQPFARDTIYNIGSDYSDVRRLSDLLGSGTTIPAGPGRDLLAASYRAALDTTSAGGVTLSGNQNLNPGWKFHQVAQSAGVGPALSGNYLTANKRYIVQVFAGDTLFTPSNQASGALRLSSIAPSDPAYNPIWTETYKIASATYDPASPFHQLAAKLHLGTPLTRIYTAELGGAPYTLQVFALDTLYRVMDGPIQRMSDLPIPEKVGWPTGTKKLVPTPTPSPEPRRLMINVGNPRRADPSWPPPPPFNFLAARAGAVEAALGHIDWQRIPGAADKDAIRIINGWDEDHLVVVDIPQLRRFRLAGYGKLRFHRKAAAQLQQLFADWEAAGLLGLILTFDGAYNPRTIRAQVAGQTTNVLSNHAYGTAFDLNAGQNGFMQQPALVGERGAVRELVPLAYANGFYWGGHFTYRGGGHDGMHFEWAVEV